MHACTHLLARPIPIRASDPRALALHACSGPPRGGGASSSGDGGVGGVGLPVERAVRGDHPRGAVRPGGRRGQRRVPGHVPLRGPARRAVRVPRAARASAGMPLQVLAARRRPTDRHRGGGRNVVLPVGITKPALHDGVQIAE